MIAEKLNESPSTNPNRVVGQFEFSGASAITEPSAVAPDAKSNFSIRGLSMFRIITKPDSNIRRYRARFCKSPLPPNWFTTPKEGSLCRSSF
jgi:hypothetical protein